VFDGTSGFDDGGEFFGGFATSHMKGVNGGEVLESECVEVCPRHCERLEDPIAEIAEFVVRFNLLDR